MIVGFWQSAVILHGRPGTGWRPACQMRGLLRLVEDQFDTLESGVEV